MFAGCEYHVYKSPLLLHDFNLHQRTRLFTLPSTHVQSSIMSVPAAPTIPGRKQAFLTAQINLLSQPLEPSRQWRTANGASEAPLPARQVDDVLFNLNHALQQHCRRVYAPQASRNVAEQISRSYTRDAERRAGDAVNSTVGRQADLGT